MKSRGIILAVAIAIGFSSVTSAETAEDRIAELEQRIEALEKAVYGNSGSKKAPMPSKVDSASNETITLSSGIYIVGKDIEPGHYSIKVIGGSDGYVNVWKDYETYKENSWSSYYANFSEYVCPPNYHSNDKEIESILRGLPTEISNIILEDGECLSIDNVVVEMVMK